MNQHQLTKLNIKLSDIEKTLKAGNGYMMLFEDEFIESTPQLSFYVSKNFIKEYNNQRGAGNVFFLPDADKLWTHIKPDLEGNGYVAADSKGKHYFIDDVIRQFELKGHDAFYTTRYDNGHLLEVKPNQ